MKSAFTMIELVFVIVILGILAAVAIPKISATRDDAKVSKSSHNIMTAIAEIASVTLATGMISADLSAMSNVISEMKQNHDVVINPAEQSAALKVGEVADCILIKIVSVGIDDNLTLTFGNNQNDPICSGVQSLINPSEYPIKLRGRHVSF